MFALLTDPATTMKTTTFTQIHNSFTGYQATIRSTGKPAVATVRKHLRKAKASDCKSVTTIEVDGVRHDLVDLGNGLELRA